MIVLVARSHPAPTQTFHRRMAQALDSSGVAVVRVALKRGDGPIETDDRTRFPREEQALAFRSFVRRPMLALGLLLSIGIRAGARNKEGGIAGAVMAWRDGLALADWVRRLDGVERFHAQFASWEATAAWVAARLVGVPFSLEIHNPYTLVRGRALLRAKLRAADVITAISEDARRRIVELAPDVAARVRIVRCGLDLAKTPPRTDDGPDVIAVGSLVARKGHDVFVRAVALVAARRPGLVGAIVGAGPERARIEALARELNAPVTLLGALPEADAWRLSASSRIAALACVTAPDGDQDGIPVALMEAMAAGTPVVSTTIGGIPELLENGEAGMLVAPGDSVALAAAIEQILDDPTLRDRLVRRGRQAIEVRHSLSRCARDLATALGAEVVAVPVLRGDPA